jgi:outer membrane protein OmpA-like peptidoglycan-associated protein
MGFANLRHDELEQEDEQDSSIFLSIGDLMSGLLMFFALLFVTALVQIQELKDSRDVFIGTLVEELNGNDLEVSVNPETGDISIRESILFSKGSAELTQQGKVFLKKFIPLYSQVIFSKDKFEEQVSRVVIEGHTSSKGSEDYNLELSLQRSFAVSRYIMSNNLKFPTKQPFNRKLLASGRGEMEADQKRDNPGDRKVLFRFQFKGDELLFKQLTEQKTQ